MRNAEELKNLERLLRQLICLWSFDTRQDAQVLRTLSEQLRTLEELRILREQEQHEELTVRALLRSLALRALLVTHLACAHASLT